MADVSFSIIIPVHNKEPHLERSINSVLAQTYSNFELIIVDDASTDGSSEKLEQFTDSRIKRFKRDTPGPGGYAARNLGIDNAAHQWICFLDADDAYEPDLLENLNTTINANPGVTMLGWGWSLTGNGNSYPNGYFAKYKDVRPAHYSFTLTDFLKGPPRIIWTGALSINKSIFAKAGNFPEHRCIRGGDVDLWIRCLYASENNIFINKNLSWYHIDSVNMVTKKARPTCPCAFNSLDDILKQTTDQALIKTINDFKDENIYDLLQRNVLSGTAIDYKLMSQMKLTKYSLVSIVKVHIKRLLWLVGAKK